MRNEGTAMVHGRWITLAVVALVAVMVTSPRQVSATSLAPFHATVAETFTADLCPPTPSLCVAGRTSSAPEEDATAVCGARAR